MQECNYSDKLLVACTEFLVAVALVAYFTEEKGPLGDPFYMRKLFCEEALPCPS